jgi:hypothetical protein
MKVQGAFLITVLAAATVLAQDQSVNPSATTTLQKPKPGLMKRIFLPERRDEGKIDRVEGESSQAWATIVGWNPGQSSFPDPVNHEARLYLLSIGADPQPYQK